MKQIIASLSILLGITTVAFTQAPQSTENKADQTLRSTGRVNPSTLGMEFDLPLGSYPGRGINLPISISYSSKLWRMDYSGNVMSASDPSGCSSYYTAKYAENSASGWTSSLAVPYIEYVGMDNPFVNGFPYNPGGLCGQPQGPHYPEYVARIVVHLPGGETHELGPSSNQSTAYYSIDSSNLKYVEDPATSTFRLMMPDGSRYDFVTGSTVQMNGATVRKATTYTDSTGNNSVTYNNTTAVVTDSLGRQFSAPLGLSAPIAPTPSDSPVVYTLPGMSSSYKFHWKSLKGTSEAESGLENYDLDDLKYPGPKYGTPSADPWWPNRTENCCLFGGLILSGSSVFNPVVLTEIELPTGQKYEFKYDIWGRIVKIVYPTGGTEKFVYSPIKPLAWAPSTNVTDQTNYGVTQRKVYEMAEEGTPAIWNYEVTTSFEGGGYKVSTVNPDLTSSDRFLHRSDGFCLNCDGSYGFDNGLAGRAYEERQFSNTGALVSRKLTHWTKSIMSAFGWVDPAHDDRHPRVDHEETMTYDSSGNGVSAVTKYEYEGDLDLAETPVLVKKITQYAYVVKTDGASYDPGDVPSASPTPVPTSTPPTPLRVSESTYLINDTNYTSTVRDGYKSRNMVGLVTLSQTKNGAGTSVAAQSEIKYDSTNYGFSYHGKPTTVRNWLDTNDSWIETKAKYDQYGNVVETTDAKNNITKIRYDSVYNAFPVEVESPIPSDGVYGSNTAFMTTTAYDTPAQNQPPLGLVVATTDVNGQTTSISYNDPTTGILDPLLRVRKVTAPNNHQTIMEYGAGTSPSTRFVKTKAQIDETQWKEGYTWYDGLGRTIKSQSVDSGGDVVVLTEYDIMGRAKKATNPYRNLETIYWTENTFDTAGRPWKVTTSDGAFVETTYSVAITGGNIGTSATVKDQAGKMRRSITNALGQLTRVDEPNGAVQLGAIDAPNQPTSYIYDLLNNLTQVQQAGDSVEECGPGSTPPCSQTRSFAYDSLSRLTSATNPESGTISYGYDSNGNLTTKTDARTITTTYIYDALNRVKTRQYTDEPNGSETPNVSYFYDLIPNANGKLRKVSSSLSTTEYVSFDILGRVTRSKQTTDGVVYGDDTNPMTYSYNLSGALIEQKYPSGRVVKNVLDSDGDLATVQSKKNQNQAFWNYANHFSYNSAGAVTSMQLGNGRWESTQFNSKLQPIQISLGSVQSATDKLKLDYQYGDLQWDGSVITGTNNGNVAKQTITVASVGATPGFTAIQNYDYDSLNRIQIASETLTPTSGLAESWTQDFRYDRYGNRTFHENTTTTLPKECNSNSEVCAATRPIVNPSAGPSNNRLNGYSFDAAGNTTRDAENRKFSYDAENKQTKVETLNGETVTGTIGEYWYDGDGKRIKKRGYIDNVVTEESIFVYDAAGKLIGEYSNQVVTAQDAKIAYLTSDHLGSLRINTDVNGNVTARYDYHPFGEQITSSVTPKRMSDLGYKDGSIRKQFTSYERDTETDLDFAQARYYGYAHGRFTSSDPYNIVFEKEDAENDKLGNGQKLFKDYISQPQNWNRYVYVWNNPLRNIDPNGEDTYVIVYTTGNSQGDEDFKRAAETRANDIRKSKGFDPKKDTVIVRGAKTLDDVQSALTEAKNLESTYGRVQQFALVSHGGPDNGPIFEFGVRGRQNQPDGKISDLKINWARNGEAYFLGCNTAVSFAQTFANNHQISTWGFTTGTSFYSQPNPLLPKGSGLMIRPGAYDYMIFNTPLYMKSQGNNPNGNFVKKLPRRY